MGARVAIVAEREENGSRWVASLREAQYEVRLFPVSSKVHQDVRAWKPEMIVYCCGGPQGPGQSSFLRLRRALSVPILVLRPCQDETVVVKALKMGADGCMCGPFGEAELLARVEAHLRRYWEWENSDRDLADGLFIDGESCSVIVGDREIKLTPAEYRLLDCLSEHGGRVVPREELSSCIWEMGGRDDSPAVVSQCIYSLRKKLERDPRHPQWIRTKRGVGYYLAQRKGRA